MNSAEKATQLLRLHRDPELLSLVNVWDVITATVIADLDGTKALATASHPIAASHGYEDGERIPPELMFAVVGRIARSTQLPVSADVEAGYGDIPATIRSTIAAGAVGANLEDQMRPLREAVAGVEDALRTAAAEGVPDFVLNARTDAFVMGGDRDPADVLRDAATRGRAYLDAGAPCVFVPGRLDRRQVETLVEAFGPQRLTVLGVPGSLSPAELTELGVARVSYGPWTQRVALTALADLGAALYAGGELPQGARRLN